MVLLLKLHNLKKYEVFAVSNGEVRLFSINKINWQLVVLWLPQCLKNNNPMIVIKAHTPFKNVFRSGSLAVWILYWLWFFDVLATGKQCWKTGKQKIERCVPVVSQRVAQSSIKIQNSGLTAQSTSLIMVFYLPAILNFSKGVIRTIATNFVWQCFLCPIITFSYSSRNCNIQKCLFNLIFGHTSPGEKRLKSWKWWIFLYHNETTRS